MLSSATTQFPLLNDLPPILQLFSIIYPHLHQAWANLRLVQKHAATVREEWLAQLASDAADEMNTSEEQALRQMVFESRLKRIYAKLKQIAKGPRTDALSIIKLPKYEWLYHSNSDMFYHYVK